MAKRAVQSVTPLSQLITARLKELGLKQVDFCRRTGFDQGLLSKLQSGVITTINLESALRLADGLQIPPEEILSLLDKRDAHLLLLKLYGNNTCSRCNERESAPEPVNSIMTAAHRAYTLGRDVSPALILLRHLSATRRRTEK
ncbi:MAG: helix-turn-helix transcriptional regulator [Pyrinomonadaceae bacterium]|nr:helix-turn-helix transcriptional regulator [Pyrinomonadaceae bacterium]